MNYSDFFDLIKSVNGVSPLWKKMLSVIKKLQPEITDEALNVITLYFSFLDSGNTCIPLEEKKLLEMWKEKWNGLLLVEEKENDEEYIKVDFEIEIKKGKDFLVSEKASAILSKEENDFSKPFMISKIDDEDWLFAEKYFKAKNSIEEKVKGLFSGSSYRKNEKAEKELLEYFKSISGISLNSEQLEAVIRGQKENLMITGGPGTGKTTVVSYLLWELLKQEKYSDYMIYLAAPSGKAADRLGESVALALEKICGSEKDNYRNIYNKLTSASTSSSTIHRLLSVNAGTGKFLNNRENPFDAKSIFVIDEASMIDVIMFKNLLEAIPEGARIFILGDKNQLPSVQAGAVLGELLSEKTDSVVELTVSNRFGSTSEAGVLSSAIQKEDEDIKKLMHFNFWDESNIENFDLPLVKGKYPVSYIQLRETNKKNQVEQIAQKWFKSFYSESVKVNAENLNKSEAEEALKKFHELYALSEKAKILCAERKGVLGSVFLNERIKAEILKEKNIKVNADEKYFPGQLLMITENQKMYSLYNGDCGIIVTFKDDPLLYFMVKKPAKDQQKTSLAGSGIFRIENYLFYPLYLLPSEAIDDGYAITIHKAQGSGYKNILVFIPEQPGHPLLNRQIIYTGITRTEGNTYIVASEETMCRAKETVIKRYTQINL